MLVLKRDRGLRCCDEISACESSGWLLLEDCCGVFSLLRYTGTCLVSGFYELTLDTEYITLDLGPYGDIITVSWITDEKNLFIVYCK